jgi:predicted permease
MSRDPADRRHIGLPRLGGKPDAEMDEEIEAHLQLRAADLQRTGLSPEAARAAAEQRFGDLDATRQVLHSAARRREAALRHRDWIAGIGMDLRFAGRQFRRYAGYSSLAIAMLALGIGLTTAMFTLVERILLQPLPFPRAEQLVALTGRDSVGNDIPMVSSADWQDWRNTAHTLTSTAIFNVSQRLTVPLADSAIRVTSEGVSADFFRVLQARFVAGRSFTSDEVQSRLAGVVVGERLWRDVLGGDPRLGRSLTIGSRRYAVIGVVSDATAFPAGTDLWIPTAMMPESGGMRNNINWTAIARLQPGASLAAAHAGLRAVATAVKQHDRAGLYDFDVHVRPLRDLVVGDVSSSFRLLMAAVLCVLLIVCTNLAMATLGRGASRRQEMAIRAALGADRVRLVVQLLVEHLLLALAGGLAGLVLAWGTIRAVLAVWGNQIPRAGEVHIDAVVLGVAVGVSVLVGLAAGIIPALRGSRASLHRAMRAGGRSVGRNRRNAGAPFVVLEFAVALLLLVGAGLLIRSFRTLLGRDLGFDRHVATAELVLSGPRYADSAQRLASWDRLMAEYRAIPSVQRVGLANWIPLGIAGASFIDLPGREGGNDGAGYRVVSEDFFTAMSIPLRAGRTFGPLDGPGTARVVVINQAMARAFWPDQDPIGKQVRARSMEYRRGGQAPWLTIVGVVGDVRQWGLESDPRPEMYTDFRQLPAWTSALTAVVQSSMPASQLLPQLRARTRAVDPLLGTDVSVLDDRLSAQLAPRRLTMALLTGFAGVALLLAALGIYGVVSYAVVQRTRELAVRAALGAQRRELLTLVLASGMGTAAAGIVVGVSGALVLSRLLGAMLAGLSPLDPLTYVAATVVMGVMALLATAVPAIRATRLDPMIVLKGG